jgi:hypothetical protein
LSDRGCFFLAYIIHYTNTKRGALQGKKTDLPFADAANVAAAQQMRAGFAAPLRQVHAMSGVFAAPLGLAEPAGSTCKNEKSTPVGGRAITFAKESGSQGAALDRQRRTVTGTSAPVGDPLQLG